MKINQIQRNGILLLMLFLALARFSLAHDATLARTVLVIKEDEVSAFVTLPDLNFRSAFPDGKIDWENNSSRDAYLLSSISISNDNLPCPSGILNESRNREFESMTYHLTFDCRRPLGSINFSYLLFFDILPRHENVLNVRLYNGSTELLMDKEYYYLEIPVPLLMAQLGLETKYENYTNPIKKYLPMFWLGVGHILTGYDHILFLLGLLLMTAGFRQLLKVVTSFTVAHSITLAASVLGAVMLPPKFTESIIALSIAYIAIENIFLEVLGDEKKKSGFMSFYGNPKHRWIITFIFGLVHGLGFSGALKGIGLSGAGMVISLFLFNLGVEAGQFLIIALSLPLLWYASRKAWRPRMAILVSGFIGLIGMYLFLSFIIISS